MNHLNQFYDEVIRRLEHANSIAVFGPGEAKGELDKRITSKALRQRLIGIVAADKMTNPQLIAKIRSHFQTQPSPTA